MLVPSFTSFKNVIVDFNFAIEKIKENYLKYQEKWEGDDYFKNKLDPKYKHIYSCALKSKNADKFESCVESYGKESRLKKLRKKLL